MKELQSPYNCHIFVCTNCQNKGEKPSSTDNSIKIKKTLKEEVNSREWKEKVRVSETGCMGLCESSLNVLLHPQNIWFSNVVDDDIETILARTKTILEADSS